MFLEGSGLRQRVEATLSHTLHRPVTIGTLTLSLATGSLVAEHLTIPDLDPGAPPLLTAPNLRMRVQILPLLLRREVRLTRFFFDSPQIHLRRSPSGTWNTASLTQPATPTSPHTRSRLPDLAADLLEIHNARVTLDLNGTTRTYDRIDLQLRDLSLTRPFPFTLSALLPTDGQLQTSGTITPAPNLTVTAHLLATHLDLANLPHTPISGLLDRVALDATWQPHQLHLANLTLTAPHLTYTPIPPSSTSSPQHPSETRVTLDTADLSLKAFTLNRPNRAALTLGDVAAHLTHLAPDQPTPFTLSAQLPGAGALQSTGTLNLPQPEKPFEISTHLTVQHLDLAASSLLPPASPITAILTLDTHLEASGPHFSATGTARLDRLKLARTGQPSTAPVTARFALTSTAGILRLSPSTIHLGPSAPITLEGTIDRSRPTPHLNLQIHAAALPIDGIESLLPSVGIQLPENSRLRGGTLTTSLTLTGTPADLLIRGPLHLEDTELAGFDLGARLQTLARYTGGRLGSATASGTHIRSLTLTLLHTPTETRTDPLTAEIAGIGTLTGGGTIGPPSADGATLHYNLHLKLTDLVAKPTPTNPNGSQNPSDLARSLAALLPPAWAAKATSAINYLARGPMRAGVPILIGGTARHPTVTPNLGALLPEAQPAAPRRPPPRTAPQSMK